MTKIKLGLISHTTQPKKPLISHTTQRKKPLISHKTICRLIPGQKSRTLRATQEVHCPTEKIPIYRTASTGIPVTRTKSLTKLFCRSVGWCAQETVQYLQQLLPSQNPIFVNRCGEFPWRPQKPTTTYPLFYPVRFFTQSNKRMNFRNPASSCTISHTRVQKLRNTQIPVSLTMHREEICHECTWVFVSCEHE